MRARKASEASGTYDMVSEGRPRKRLAKERAGVPARLEAMKFRGQCDFSVFSSKLNKPSLEKGIKGQGNLSSCVVSLPPRALGW